MSSSNQPRLGALAIQSVGDGRHTLVLAGELDVAHAGELGLLLVRVSEDGVRGITLDLTGLTFIDATGLRAVLDAKELCAEIGCEFELVPGPPDIWRLFDEQGAPVPARRLSPRAPQSG